MKQTYWIIAAILVAAAMVVFAPRALDAWGQSRRDDSLACHSYRLSKTTNNMRDSSSLLTGLRSDSNWSETERLRREGGCSE